MGRAWRKYYIEFPEDEADLIGREADRSLREFKAEVLMLVREALVARGALPESALPRRAVEYHPKEDEHGTSLAD